MEYYIENELTGIGDELEIKDENGKDFMTVEPTYYFLYGDMFVDNIKVKFPDRTEKLLYEVGMPQYLLKQIEDMAYKITSEHNAKTEL
jgi:hypothetical protein